MNVAMFIGACTKCYCSYLLIGVRLRNRVSLFMLLSSLVHVKNVAVVTCLLVCIFVIVFLRI